jgi:hypothetical protein
MALGGRNAGLGGAAGAAAICGAGAAAAGGGGVKVGFTSAGMVGLGAAFSWPGTGGSDESDMVVFWVSEGVGGWWLDATTNGGLGSAGSAGFAAGGVGGSRFAQDLPRYPTLKLSAR